MHLHLGAVQVRHGSTQLRGGFCIDFMRHRRAQHRLQVMQHHQLPIGRLLRAAPNLPSMLGELSTLTPQKPSLSGKRATKLPSAIPCALLPFAEGSKYPHTISQSQRDLSLEGCDSGYERLTCTSNSTYAIPPGVSSPALSLFIRSSRAGSVFSQKVPGNTNPGYITS